MNLSDEQFRSWGWRIPFLLSAALVMVGLYVRLKLKKPRCSPTPWRNTNG
jgi:hypothetical protein